MPAKSTTPRPHTRNVRPLTCTVTDETRRQLRHIRVPRETWTLSGAIREAVRYWIEMHPPA